MKLIQLVQVIAEHSGHSCESGKKELIVSAHPDGPEKCHVATCNQTDEYHALGEETGAHRQARHGTRKTVRRPPGSARLSYRDRT